MSLLSRLACRVAPLKAGNQDFLADHDAFINRPDPTLAPLSADVVELATAVGVRYGVHTPDTLQVANCLQFGDGATLVTGDRILQRVGGLPVAHLAVPCVIRHASQHRQRPNLVA